MKSPIYVTNRKQTASFRIVGLLLAITPLWLMLAAANSFAHAQTASPSDWSEFHRDNMQRWNPYETVLGVGNARNLHLKWSLATGADAFGIESSSPALVNGVAYFGSFGDLNVYALDASTGVKLWSYSPQTVVSSAPAVSNGVVYIACDGGVLYALNAKTGAKLWSYSTGTSKFVSSAPTVADGVVYFGSGDTMSSGGAVYALKAATGALLWSYATGGAIHSSSPAVANGAVFIGSEDGKVYALNAGTGVKLWSYTTGNPVFSSPAVANGVVYVGSFDKNVYALNASTGVKLWSYTTGNQVLSSPAVANGVVYVGSYDGNVYALNATTGASLWSFTTGDFVLSSPAVANGVVYIGSEDDNIYALNASTGVKLWNFIAFGTVNGSPAVVNGALYANTAGHLYAFSVGADLFLRINPSSTTIHQGDLLTYAFPVWNLGPDIATHEVLTTRVPAGTTFDYLRISGTPGLGTCTHPPYGGTGTIVCHENGSMASNATWTVRLTVRVTAPSGTVITESGHVTADTADPNLANNTATVSDAVQ
jgi:outer membrane protein assembly factor BamB